MERIEADLLVPGKGEPVHDGVVVWDGPVITYAGPAAGARPAEQAPRTHTAAVLPGLWDCHGHLLGTRTLDQSPLPTAPAGPLPAAPTACRQASWSPPASISSGSVASRAWSRRYCRPWTRRPGGAGCTSR